MSALEVIIPTPRRVELDSIDLAMTQQQAWELLRHGDLGRGSPLIRALFALRALPSRLSGTAPEPVSLSLDALTSSPEHPGFRVLHESAPTELVVGAIGKVWQLDIPFVHAPTREAFAAFSEPGFIKVAWAIRLGPCGERDTHVEIEVRVDATDSASWKKFRRYFKVIGPASRFIRKALLSRLAHEHGTPESKEQTRPLPGDELLSDAALQSTEGVTIAARPEAVWPWLVQMGCNRGGFYSIDRLDNGGVESARELHADLQDLRVGDVIPATPDGRDGFEVLRIEKDRTLILGALYDAEAKRELPFAAERPDRYWHVTWAFVLEPLDGRTTRLHVRGRVAHPEAGAFHAAWIRPIHRLMQTAQLHHLAARAEGRLARDTWHDVAEGAFGAAIMTAAMLTPFLRTGRNHWGLDTETAARSHPSDELVAEARWSWTHGIEIDAPADQVWRWVGQIGAGRAGFYSYQWLENVVGCQLRNAESIHSEWMVREGGTLVLHPKIPPLTVVSVMPGRYFVAYARSEPETEGGAWVETSWLFWVEPLANGQSRFISRYRCGCSDDLVNELTMGPTFIEPIGFAMDRRMLLGVKERAERAAKALSNRRFDLAPGSLDGPGTLTPATFSRGPTPHGR